MNPADMFVKEHRLIGRVVDALEAYVEALNGGEGEHRHDLLAMVTFFREYADLCHHEKEESILLPFLNEHGFDWSDGPIDEIRKEHDHERYLMRAMRQAALQTGDWSKAERKRIVEVSRTFVEFMRNHVDKEEKILLPKLRELPEAACEKLEKRLTRFDKSLIESGETELLRRLARDVLARWGKPGAADAD